MFYKNNYISVFFYAENIHQLNAPLITTEGGRLTVYLHNILYMSETELNAVYGSV